MAGIMTIYANSPGLSPRSVMMTERGLRELSTYGRLKIRCLCLAVTMTECLLRRGVHLWKVKNAVFLYG